MKTITLLVVCLMLPMVAVAQYGKKSKDTTTKPTTTTTPAVDPEEVQKRVADFKTRLNLTEEQEQALKPLMQEEAQKLRAIKEKYGDDTSRRARRSMLDDAKKVQKDFDGKLEKILNQDQMKTWKEMQKERRARMKEEYQKRQSGS